MLLPREFYLPIAAALGVSWQVWAFGFKVGSIRKDVFNEDFMRKEWGQIHQSEIGDEIQRGGFPDTGNGLYSSKLSYRDWYHFNVLQRIHLNAVENVNLAQSAILSAGLYRPKEAALLGLFYVLGRLLYAKGSRSKKGALSKIRIFGLGLSTLTIVINSGIFIYHFAQAFKK